MAAPSGTVWGAVETTDNYGRIGLYVSTSSTATVTTVSIQVWFWSKYSATDSNNKLYFNDKATAASTSRGTTSIKTTVNSGSWSTSNQQLIYTYPSFTVKRTTSAQTRSCAAKLTGVEIASGTMTATATYSIPALQSYTISYNANDKNLTSALPSSHIKYYGVDTNVSSTVPTTTGYTCQGWVTAAPEYKFYAFGATYSGNTDLVLYASWVINTYKVTCVDLSGSNASAELTKTYGISLTLPALTRANYNFLGWSTSSTATSATYAPGASYTTNSAVTLYAVWELAYVPPIISKVVVERSDANGNPTDEGTHFNVSFEWETDKNFANKDGTTGVNGTSIVIRAIDSDGHFAKLGADDAGNLIDNFEKEISGFSGIVDEVAVGPPGTDGIGPISTELSYVVYIEVRDTHGSTIIQRSIMPIAYPIDIYKEGKGIAFGMPAKKEGVFDVKFNLGDNLKLLLLDFFYPVNSIYISYSHDNPETLFGGKWVRIANRFLWGCDASGDIGATGGASTVALDVSEMPRHSHPIRIDGYGTANDGALNYYFPNSNEVGYFGYNADNGYLQATGGGEPHENMPPYIQVSIWRRTA